MKVFLNCFAATMWVAIPGVAMLFVWPMIWPYDLIPDRIARAIFILSIIAIILFVKTESDGNEKTKR